MSRQGAWGPLGQRQPKCWYIKAFISLFTIFFTTTGRPRTPPPPNSSRGERSRVRKTRVSRKEGGVSLALCSAGSGGWNKGLGAKGGTKRVGKTP
jgi:hypothetical protein